MLKAAGVDSNAKGKDYLDGLRKAQSNPKTAQPVRDLIGQYFHALQTLKAEEKVGGDKGLANRPQGHSEAKTGVNYGLLNLSEFLSEAFTNKNFQDLLNTIKDPRGGTVWSRILDSVTRLLGFKPHDKALLASVLKTGEEIGDIQNREARQRAGLERVPAPIEEPPNRGRRVETNNGNTVERWYDRGTRSTVTAVYDAGAQSGWGGVVCR